MTGRRPIRSTPPGGPRGRSRATRTGALTAGALVACAALAAGCGVVPGATGGVGVDGPLVLEGTRLNNTHPDHYRVWR
ncbi:hypothetical protein AB0E99_15320, partial [Streptomyces sp. NPDC030592]